MKRVPPAPLVSADSRHRGGITLARIGSWLGRVVAAALAGSLISAFAAVGAHAQPRFTSEPPTDATVSQRYSYTMTATYDGDDADDVVLLFSAVELPSWLAFDGNDTISGTPATEDVGDHPVRVSVRRADDPSEFDEQAYTIDVAADPNAPPPNSPPALTSAIPDQSAIEGQSFELDTTRYFDDADGDALDYTPSGLPSGLTLNSGVISGAPAAGTADGSPYDVTITASDGQAATSDTFRLTVAAQNAAPVLDRPIEPDPQSATEGASFRFDAAPFFSDPDGDTLTFSASGLPTGLAIDSEGTMSGTPAEGTSSGSPYSVTVTASDGRSAASDSFTLNVAAANAAPVLESPIAPDPQTVQEGERFEFDVAAFFIDPDGDDLRFSATGLPSGLAINDRGRITGRPDTGTAAGSPYAVSVSASDGRLAASDSFTLNVTSSNEPPTLPDPPPRLETREDTPLTITAEMLDAVDEDVGSLTVILTPPSSGDDFTLSGDATVDPADDFNGTLAVEARVRDSEATSNAVTVTIDVTPVNDAPRIEPIPPQSATEGVPFTLDLGDYVSDVEGDALEYRASGLPQGLTIDAVRGTVSGTVTVGADSRDYDVDLTVDDGDETSRESFVISVLEADRADLGASVEVAPNPVLVDEDATWTLTAHNRGGIDVANLTLDAEFSGDTPYRLDEIGDASCSLEPRGNDMTVACRWGPLAGGESTSVDVTGRASEVGQIETTATVGIADAAPIDDSAGNDVARVVLEVTERISSGPSQELDAPGAVAAAAGDFDGDGIDDLAVATGAGEPTLIFLNVPDENDGNKRVFSTTPLSAGEPTAATAIAAADLDGDGNADIVVANADGADHVLFNAGAASFETVVLDGAAEASRAVAIADVDGDGLPDIALAGDGQNAVHRNLGSRQFAGPEAASAGPGTAVAAADLSGDGLPELVFASRDADAAVLRRGAGAYQQSATLGTGPAASVAAADFDSDGVADLAFGTDSQDPVFLNTSGGGALSFFLTDRLGASATAALLLGDFDADGRNDVVEIGASGTHRLYKNSGTANTTFALHPEQFAGRPATGAVAGLFDADDRIDVAVAGGGVVAVFLNDGLGNFGTGNTGAPQLTLNGEPTVTITVGDEYVDAGATATDDLDGDLTSEVDVDNPVDTHVIGTYTVTYSVVDSAGNRAALTRTVEVRARSGSGGGGGGAAGIALLLLASFAAWTRLIRSGR